MAKVITFSRTFPAYHHKAGKPTHFVEKFYKSIFFMQVIPQPLRVSFDEDVFVKCLPKHHTIRAGHRWNVGDEFSPRVWSGKPYNSPQIKLSAPIKIKKTWNVEIWKDTVGQVHIGISEGNQTYALLSLGEVAKNDGLTSEDLIAWFNVKVDKPFLGQIICWNDTVDYDK